MCTKSGDFPENFLNFKEFFKVFGDIFLDSVSKRAKAFGGLTMDAVLSLTKDGLKKRFKNALKNSRNFEKYHKKKIKKLG